MVPPSKEMFNVFDLKFLKDAQTHAQTISKAARQSFAGRFTNDDSVQKGSQESDSQKGRL